MLGMLTLGSGGGLLNGETQKAIMAVVPRERAGMASGISTTTRFSGILLGFAVLSGILASMVRATLMKPDCNEVKCSRAFSEAVIAGDLPNALAGLETSARELAISHAMAGYSYGFSSVLLTSGTIAILSAIAVRWLLGSDR
jgi:hypothetical protein